MAGGSNRHKPTDAQREVVKALASYGTPQVDIAAYIGISKPTLEKHYRAELDTAATHATAQVAQSFFKKCVGAPAVIDQATGKVLRAEVKPDTIAQIFWLKARAGWRDTTAVEHSGKDGAPLEVNVVLSGPLAGV